MDKFARIAHALTTTCKATHPESSTLSRPLVRQYTDFFRPLDMDEIPINDWLLTGLIDLNFIQRFLHAQLTDEECRYIGFREQTHRKELIERTVLEVAGTVLTCQLAYYYGIAANAAGGTHHAHPTGGAGYTIINDLAVSTHCIINIFQLPYINKVLIIDCDVHQGDGTAKFGNTPLLKNKLFTLSLHCASNYPQLKEKSTFDVGLADKMRDEEYLRILEDSVNHAIDVIQPDFIIYDAGVDIYEYDKLGRLHITEAGIRARDRWVLEKCVSLNIPVAAVVGGGYDKDVDALARRHAIVHEECAYIWRKYQMWKR